jgi:predicted transcriptional regulator
VADGPSLIELTADVVASYLGRNNVATGDLPNLIRTVYRALSSGSEAAPAPGETVTVLTKAQIRKTITPSAIISLEDGKPYKSMKRHLAGRGLTPAEYRAKWGLPKDYAMVSPAYAAARSELAKAMGLGRKAAVAAPEPPKPVEPAPRAAAAAKKPRAARKPR